MNSDASTLWSQNLHEENMVPPVTTEEDFANYLDLDLDFSNFENVPPEQSQGDVKMDGYNMGLEQEAAMMANGNHMNYNPQHQAMHQHHQQMQSRGPPQGQMYQQQPRRYQRPSAIIPPTPSSNELSGGVASYYHPVSGQLMYDYHNKDDQVSFSKRALAIAKEIDHISRSHLRHWSPQL